jgi:hypothetical protein
VSALSFCTVNESPRDRSTWNAAANAASRQSERPNRGGGDSHGGADLRGVETRTHPSARRSLAPREHGAYGQLAFPLLGALALGRPSLAAGLWCLASAALFAAHEPALVLAGKRGARAREIDGRRARAALIAWLAAGVALGLAGFLLAPAAARVALAVPALLGAAVAAAVALDREKTLGGELLAAGALSSVALPVALAAGARAAVAAEGWAVWLAGFGAATISVRAAILSHRGVQRRALAAGAVVGVGACAILLSAWRMAPLWPALPLIGAALVLAVRPPRMKSMQRIGWTLVAASAATAVLLVTAFR